MCMKPYGNTHLETPKAAQNYNTLSQQIVVVQWDAKNSKEKCVGHVSTESRLRTNPDTCHSLWKLGHLNRSLELL